MGRLAQIDARPRLLTVDGAAAYIGVTRRVIEQYLQQGVLTVVRLPGTKDNGKDLRRTLIERKEIDDLVDGR